MFKCDKCGECCKNLDKSFLYAELDNGEGVCKYLIKNLCSIYEIRPLLCRIDESYDAFFKNSISRNKYYQLNYEFCEKLKKQLL